MQKPEGVNSGKSSSKQKKVEKISDKDWSFIIEHSDKSNFELPQFYDKNEWKIGETYRMRVGNIYDPSKFWIVLKERELTLFQNFLYNFYQCNGEFYKIPIDKVKRNLYCVAFSDGAYYRALIVNIPHFATLTPKAVVYMFDFGYVGIIKVEDLYYFSKNMFDVPQFATRACLYGVEPYDTDTWTSKVVTRLEGLTDKKILLGLLELTDPSRKIVFIHIGDVDQFKQVRDIGSLLMNEKLAKVAKLKTKIERGIGKLVPKTKYPFLCPSFEAIESGLMPSTVHVTELLKQCITSIVLLKPYYTYNGLNLSD